MHKQVDVLFCGVPYIESSEPILAPAVLKSIAIQHGFSAVAIDLNIQILKFIYNEPDDLRSEIVDYFYDKDVTTRAQDKINTYIQYCTYAILKHNPKRVGLSLLTYMCQRFAKELATELKKTRPTVEIFIGGSGIKKIFAGSNNSYCQELVNSKIIDHYIMGDGEHAIPEYLKGNYAFNGIDTATWLPIDDLDVFPYPNFDDYNLKKHYTPNIIPLCDSRGCVKDCEFCDIIQHWGKFKYRKAECIFNEMLHQIATYGISNFFVYSSLINGNMKEFMKLMRIIAEYNDANPTQQISWKGSFIVRNSKAHNEEMWKLMSKTNATLLLGVESAVKSVRYGLGKKIDDEDIDYHLEMAKIYNVKLVLLMIAGYPTETRADYEFTKQWFIDRLQYARQPVITVNLMLAEIYPGTRLDDKKSDYDIHLSSNVDSTSAAIQWVSKKTSITFDERLKYFKELQEITKLYGDTRIPYIKDIH